MSDRGRAPKRVRIGVVGLGGISQQMHLPYIVELADRFELVGVCDASEGLARCVGERYGVAWTTDHRVLLGQGPDAVLIAVNGPAEDLVVAALDARAHVFAEKPLAWSPPQALRIKRAQESANRVLLVGYMKRYDPGVLLASRLLAECAPIRGALVRCVAGPNELYIRDVARVERFDDLPLERAAERQEATVKRLDEVIGTENTALALAYKLILGITCHELSVLDGLFGPPEEVLSTTVWDEGRWVQSTLRYPGMHLSYVLGRQTSRCFDEVFELYSDRELISIAFPSPFLKNAPTVVTRRTDHDGTTITETCVASYEEAFRRELEHFHECVAGRAAPRTDIDEAISDAYIMAAMIQSARDGSPKRLP
jgi:predicted dehydrogenase